MRQQRDWPAKRLNRAGSPLQSRIVELLLIQVLTHTVASGSSIAAGSSLAVHGWLSRLILVTAYLSPFLFPPAYNLAILACIPEDHISAQDGFVLDWTSFG
jgi:hypothetical protein